MSAPRDWRNPPPIDYAELKKFIHGAFATGFLICFVALCYYLFKIVLEIYAPLLHW